MTLDNKLESEIPEESMVYLTSENLGRIIDTIRTFFTENARLIELYYRDDGAESDELNYVGWANYRDVVRVGVSESLGFRIEMDYQELHDLNNLEFRLERLPKIGFPENRSWLYVSQAYEESNSRRQEIFFRKE